MTVGCHFDGRQEPVFEMSRPFVGIANLRGSYSPRRWLMKRCAVLVVAVAMLATACVRPSKTPTVSPQLSDFYLVVRNNGWLDEDVYVYYLGHRTRVGMVTGYSTASLFVRARYLQPSNQLQILVHPIGGGRDYLSDVVTLSDDQHPELSIDLDLNSVSLAVMPNRDVSDEPN